MGYLLVLAFSGMTAHTCSFLAGNIGTLFAIVSLGVMTGSTIHQILMRFVREGGRFLASFGLQNHIGRTGITGNTDTNCNAKYHSQGCNTKYDFLSHFSTPLS